MIGKVIDINITDAYITFEDGTTKYVSLSNLPRGTAIGDSVNTDPGLIRLNNSKLMDFF